jgi:hypothetical protein
VSFRCSFIFDKGGMMKTQKNVLLVLVILFVVSCMSQAPSPTPVAMLAEPVPTKTFTPTLMPTQTRTPSPSATATIVEPTYTHGPTLTSNERQDAIANLMKGNENCLFPCWWGVVPGKTSWIRALGLLTYLKLDWQPYELPEGMTRTATFARDGDFQHGHVSFTIINMIIQDIYINGNGSYDSAFIKRWENYSFSKVLKTYGRPTRLWLIIVRGGEKSSIASYHLLLFYDDLESLIIYPGGTADLNKICPDFSYGQVGWLDIYLQNPDKSRKITDITAVKKRIENLDKPYYDVEKMTEERIHELYNLFMQSKEPACFGLNTN